MIRFGLRRLLAWSTTVRVCVSPRPTTGVEADREYKNPGEPESHCRNARLV